jgi:hypothetical protein
MSTSLGVADTMTLISSKLTKIVPWSGCSLFVYDRVLESLTCAYGAGLDAPQLVNCTIANDGLADWVGYRHASIPFDVEARAEGQGKWSLWKLAQLATTAIVSFTSAPLQIVTVLGILTLGFGAVVGADALIAWFQGRAVSGSPRRSLRC